MACKFFVILACLALSYASVVKREEPNVLQEIEKQATEFQKTFSEQFNKIVNSQSTAEWQKAVKDGSDSTLTQINTLSTSLQGAITDATGKSKELLEAARANLDKTVEDLRKAHPEVEAQAGALKDKIQAAVENSVQETKKLVKDISSNVEQTNQKLAPKIKEAFDNFVAQAQEMQKKLHDAANKQ